MEVVIIEACMKEAELATLKVENKNIMDDIVTIKKDIADLSKVYDSIYGLTTNVSLLTEQMSRTIDDIKVIKSDVEEIKSIPLKNYDSIKKTIVNLIITAIVLYLISKTFLGG